MKRTISEILAIAVSNGEVGLDDLRGCMPETVETLQRTWGVTFPPIYAQFLGALGESAGDLFRADNVLAFDLERLQEAGREWAIEHRVSPSSFPVFFVYGHHEYEFAFFAADGSDDPTAYVVTDSILTPTVVDEHLSGLLYQMVERAVADVRYMRDRLKRRR
jgi:hypothetical protein